MKRYCEHCCQEVEIVEPSGIWTHRKGYVYCLDKDKEPLWPYAIPEGCAWMSEEEQVSILSQMLLSRKPINDVVSEEDNKIFRAIEVVCCPEGSACAFEEEVCI